MPPTTKAEALTHYNRAEANRSYFQSQSNHFKGLVDQYAKQRESEISQRDSKKKYLKKQESRLSDLRAIITLLSTGQPLDSSISSSNRSAAEAKDAYASAIQCTDGGSSNADIEEIFHTKSVWEDTFSNDAYNLCITEKTNTETRISNTKLEITRLTNSISSLDTDIAVYKKKANDAYSNALYWRNQRNTYWNYYLTLPA